MLDAERAISYHIAWKDKLRTFLDGTDLDATGLLSEADCPLGKEMLSGDIEDQLGLKEAALLRATHARVHREAEEIIRLRFDGEIAEAKGRYTALEALSDDLFQLLRFQLGGRHSPREITEPPVP